MQTIVSLDRSGGWACVGATGLCGGLPARAWCIGMSKICRFQSSKTSLIWKSCEMPIIDRCYAITSERFLISRRPSLEPIA